MFSVGNANFAPFMFCRSAFCSSSCSCSASCEKEEEEQKNRLCKKVLTQEQMVPFRVRSGTAAHGAFDEEPGGSDLVKRKKVHPI